MNYNTFEKLISLLEKNTKISAAAACLDKINSEEIIHHPGFDITSAHALDIYRTRHDIQKNITHAHVTGYESLIENLENYSIGNIKISKITTSELAYIIFSDEQTKILLGILLSPYVNIEEEKKFINKDTIAAGMTDAVVYNKRVRI